ncbi:hypothetical protein [Streptomyces sp. NPDC056672]
MRAHFHHHAVVVGVGVGDVVGDGNSSGRAWVKVKIKDDQGDLSLGWRTS